ncbi:MAG TPA: lipopolysaccharide kinase InaA family protein [Planctomycetota bacterium]
MSTRIPSSPRRIRGAPHWENWLEALPPEAELAARSLGSPVTNHRTSWVRRLSTPRGDLFVKTYEYATWASRLRDAARRTGPCTQSRAAREFDALLWLRMHQLPAPEPLAVLEVRRLGFLVRATLVSAAFAGERIDELMPRLGLAEREQLALAIGKLVRHLHELGFRDRNLDLRNLLAQRVPGGWSIAKIDSPRHVLRAPGNRADALVLADWARLLPQLERFGVADIARAAGTSSMQ